jgi:DnaJ-class molecular chaperone
MAKRDVRPCMHCNGAGRVWNDKTKQNDKICPACNGTGRVIISTI